MSFVMQCPCGQQMTVEEQHIGREVTCVSCKQALTVPQKPLDPSAIAPAQYAKKAEAPSAVPGTASYGATGAAAALPPHRGVLVLVFGILGLVTCVLFGIAAWHMGNHDLKEMQAGRMDPSGQQLTNVGRILGGVAYAILALVLVFTVGALLIPVITHVSR